MVKIAIYGKGGIGKSTIATSLCAVYAREGQRVLFIGCDPKHDASMKLVDEFPVRTIMGAMAARGERSVRLEDFLMKGRLGIDCIEIGGPEPGVGCAGRGITKSFELLSCLGFAWTAYDAVVYDVLGDVVCGGFAAPLHAAHAEQVYVVVSGEVMSLFAANNVCHAVKRFGAGGVVLGGLIGNARNVRDEEAILTRFAKRLNARMLALLPRDETVQDAERARRTVIEHPPAASAAKRYTALAQRIARVRPAAIRPPRPMSELQFDEFVKDLHDGKTGR